MRRVLAGSAVVLLLAVAALVTYRFYAVDRNEQLRFERGEMQVICSSTIPAEVRLFRAGSNLEAAAEVSRIGSTRISLPQGNYYLRASRERMNFFYPVPVVGYNAGPEADGSLVVTVRGIPPPFPPTSSAESVGFAFIPAGHFLLGDRLNPREQHYVWTTAFFAAPFETTNAEFRIFMHDRLGYAEDTNWTAEGRAWKAANPSHATAILPPDNPDWPRFGRPDQPVVNVTWYEANAYCRWLTRKLGSGRWLYSLPNDAEWEKAARGPDNFDYGLGMSISDAEAPLYNWRKNPGVPVTVVGISESRSAYRPNRFGLYHVSGNVAEWTQSIFRPYGRELPYTDDERNHDAASGRRTVRGGSWYSATTAPLYIPYRDAFQPDHSNNDLGFRVVARLP